MIFEIPYKHPPLSRKKDARTCYERDKFAILARFAFGTVEIPKRVAVVVEISLRSRHGGPRLMNIAAGVLKTLNESGLLFGNRVCRLKITRGKRKENKTRIIVHDYDKNSRDRAV